MLYMIYLSAEIIPWNQLMTSTYRVLKNKLIKFKKQEDEDPVVESWNLYLYSYAYKGHCSVILYLQHGFYIVISKIKHKLFIAWKTPTAQGEILGARLCPSMFNILLAHC
jgi:hypothetical protein